VAKVLGSDSRIGPKFLKASVGFGGSCFKKDLLSLVYLCEFYGLTEPAAYWQSVQDLNEWQKRRFAQMAAAHAKKHGGVVAVLGLAFKKNTNDFRESPAIDICNHLLAEGVKLRLQDERVDPKAFGAVLVDEVKAGFAFFPKVEDAAQGEDAIIVLTEWDQYATLDWRKLSAGAAPGAMIFDGRTVVDQVAAREAGWPVFTVGIGASGQP
jgi:UDPglucose 6-dehydrogenase